MFSHGGTVNTNIKHLKWLEKLENLGAGEILLTSMDRDGTKWIRFRNCLKLQQKF